jgi:hypothetical protein
MELQSRQPTKQDIAPGALALSRATAAYLAAGNYSFGGQFGVPAPATFRTTIAETALLVPKVTGKFIVKADISGLASIGVTDATMATLDVSTDGGATFTPIQAVFTSGLDAAGIAAATTVLSSFLFLYPGILLPVPGPSVQFRVSVTAAGAAIAYGGGQGGIFAQELPQ